MTLQKCMEHKNQPSAHLPVSPSPYSAIESVSLSGPGLIGFDATDCRPTLLLSSLKMEATVQKAKPLYLRPTGGTYGCEYSWKPPSSG